MLFGNGLSHDSHYRNTLIFTTQCQHLTEEDGFGKIFEVLHGTVIKCLTCKSGVLIWAALDPLGFSWECHWVRVLNRAHPSTGETQERHEQCDLSLWYDWNTVKSCVKHHSVNQSTNQSIDQSINQSIIEKLIKKKEKLLVTSIFPLSYNVFYLKMFSIHPKTKSSFWATFLFSSALSLSLDQSKILWFGEELSPFFAKT